MQNSNIAGHMGLQGPQGVAGLPGINGATGATGSAGLGGILGYADFYALMPPDNADTVAVGGNVDFPNDGPNSNTGITRLSVDSFKLTNIGAYYVEKLLYLKCELIPNFLNLL